MSIKVAISSDNRQNKKVGVDMVVLHQCTLNDLAELQQLSRATFIDTFGGVNQAADLKAYLERAYATSVLAAELANRDSFFYFLQDQGTTVGYLKLNVEKAQTEHVAPNALEVERIYILPAYKRHGFGHQLIKQAEQQALRLHKTALWLGVWEHNEPARAFYQKNGFHQVGRHTFQLGSDQQNDLILIKSLH
ncbi:GNAT family N-acetyltransferase [Lapidilactobacillus luobeiensis]|uniref:GNAT family N-acetyltransferase n=1 Tax=Lapidilactobacillus luobeiensis TaxID=2950371 RepID=UPI0021C2A9E7|nr:GNAT family N-acetyltransferase [Lapidilactobacillus luobeiensis]